MAYGLKEQVRSTNLTLPVSRWRQVTSLHNHPWEHEVYIIEGNGDIWNGEKRYSIGEGDVIYIPPGEPHTFINTSDKTLRFICCIPADVDLNQIKITSQ